MSRIIPFRATGKKRVGKPHAARDQIPPTCGTGSEEGMVTIQLKDGTSKTISGRNLELDMEYRDGVPYLVVWERR